MEQCYCFSTTCTRTGRMGRFFFFAEGSVCFFVEKIGGDVSNDIGKTA